MSSYVRVFVYEVGLNRFYTMCFTYMYVTASAFTYNVYHKQHGQDQYEWLS